MNFQIKELPFCIRKQNSIKSLKNWNSDFLQKDIVKNQRLKDYDIKDTKLTVMQDTTDLKSDILSEINFNKSELSQKDVSILKLKKELALNTYDNKSLLAEIKILFPEINNISMGNHTFNENTDSSRTVPVLIYKSKEGLTASSEKKLSRWLQQRLVKKHIEMYSQK